MVAADAKQDGDRISKQFLCSTWKKGNERPNVGGVSIRSRNGAPSRKECVSMVELPRQAINEYAPPLFPYDVPCLCCFTLHSAVSDCLGYVHALMSS